ncbi:arginine--tRNA ligase [Candidatus Saccharibacteria bacterium]|nr:arginine--tRNA ligase [Candidatus Saccharibacteria bacterium]
MEQLENKIRALVIDLFGQDTEVELTRPDEQFGDFSTNIALKLSKSLDKNPREVAAQISESINNTISDMVTSATVAGPGFINLRLNDNILIDELNKPNDKLYRNQTILVEYSDPNPFKPLHAGHLYTTLVGDMIARLVEMGGAKVIRLNYGGDVGLHVGKCMWGIIKNLGGELPDNLDDVSKDERPAYMGQRYVEGNIAYEDDEEYKQQIIAINKRVYELHKLDDHDSPFAQIYWICRKWSYDYFAQLYDELEVRKFDRFIPESEVTHLGVKTIQEQLQKGVYEESDGAIIFDGDKHGLHKRVFINSEGLPTYEAKDVGLSLTKWADYHFDKSIIITANEQDQYMQVVIKSIEQFEPEPAKRTQHITHGVVKLQGGVKMSSRKGNVVTALEILDAARQAGDESETKPNNETILAAVKYAFAKNRIGGDIIYDPKESIALEGNSGPYLQYAHARARSIIAKSDRVPSELSELEAEERIVVKKLTEWNDVMNKATEELAPHVICTYLYELAQIFNRFYENNRVIGDKRETIRLKIVEIYANRLKQGLDTLGIVAPDRM